MKLRALEVEEEMEKNILNLDVLSRCGGSGLFVSDIKTLEAATNDGLDLAWDIKLNSDVTGSILGQQLKNISLSYSEPNGCIWNIILIYFFSS